MNHLENIPEFEELSYEQQIETLIRNGFGDMDDMLAEEWLDADEYDGRAGLPRRVQVLSEMLKEYGKPTLTNKGYGGILDDRRGWYSGRKNLMYINPDTSNQGGMEASRIYQNDVNDSEYREALFHGKDAQRTNESIMMPVSSQEATIMAELGHVLSNLQGSKQYNKRMISRDKLGTGGNLSALLERSLVNTGQGLMDFVGNYQPKTKLGTKFSEKILDPLSSWMAGYDRPGSEEYYAHQRLEPLLQEQYRRRLAGYEYEEIPPYQPENKKQTAMSVIDEMGL